ncbi:isocitrate lyase/PEP mutase family protein [Thalassospira mesophila]|uniref:Carboxyvinyl-carboxyphosphonate phosphorylmutase n=1 Tax=Thalassospira mesophila TaxID=1293891 RepID=A0A1Y2KZ10_9PROT|nr:isocitrate lyase/PEP mutase family protein [Thalassospira mesophila]OSQ36809.1 carboxyvinyl-carboxyphosphonate phosphorylmutase [Thalassospira mesophila]
MTPANTLRAMLARDELITMPCCFDALSAKLIEQEGFGLTFMSGFSAAAARIGEPDLGLMSYGEVLDQARNITDAVSIPVIGDGDTGYGNAMNVKRTVRGFAKAGCAAIMIEDQVAPKRCGHTKGKEVVRRDEAFDRIRAAVDARDGGADILILARTDARHEHGLTEAIDRAAKFAELGADILFVEAPKSVDEMRTICDALPGAKMANILEGGETPDLSPAELQEIGFKIAAYPLSLMAAAMKAMVQTLQLLKAGSPRSDMLMEWPELRQRIGFDDYYEQSAPYATSRRD